MSVLLPGTRSLYFLNERELRTHLSQVYVAITSATTNAELIAKHDISKISQENWMGNNLARKCALDMHDWLLILKNFCVTREIFNEQVLDPIRIAAKYVLDVDRLESHTTNVTCWIFKISQPYYDDMHDTRITLSMVVPDLATIVSVRIKATDLQNISHGFYKFGNIKPIPLVNRMKQLHNTFTKVSQPLELSKWDFLKIGFDDRDDLRTSFEMELFCEIGSTNDQDKRRLGSAFIIVGKVISVREPRIMIQSIVDDGTVTMIISEDFIQNTVHNDFENFMGKYVRVMAIQWYDPEITNTNTTTTYELVCIEQ